MKNYLFIALLAFLSLPGALFAEKIPATAAAELGTRAFQQRCDANSNAVLKDMDFLTYNGDTTIALLHFQNGGFLLLSLDDAVQPVLGYSTTNDLFLHDLAPATQNWLNDYQEQIFQVRKLQLSANENVAAEWRGLISATKATRSVVISPLVAATWDQSQYYNDLCPADEDSPHGYGGHVPNGCVAVAMSMVIHYYRYPTTGQRSHTYRSDYGSHSVNFAAQTYHFDAMPYSLSKRCHEVAKLIYHCGVAVDMDYAPDGSSSHTDYVRRALPDYYKYSSDIRSANRQGGWGGNDGYTDSVWIALLKSDLNLRHPIVHSGCATDGCHAFICDGYDSDDLFHFNWGWGGHGNGFFTINYLHSGNGDFNYSHTIVYNIHPPTQDYDVTSCNSRTLTATAGSLEDGSGNFDYPNNNYCTYIIAPPVGKRIVLTINNLNTQEDADFLRLYDGDPENGGNLLREFSGTSFNPQESFVSNTGVAYVTFQSDNAVTAPGWKLRYTAKRFTECPVNQLFTAPSGSFDDGSGDDEYASDANCSWTIAPTNATSVTMNFTQFAISPEDWVEVFVGSTTNNLQLEGTYTGSTFPSAIHSTGVICVKLFSDNYLQDEGFAATWISNGTEPGEDTTFVADHAAATFEVFPNPANSSIQLFIPQQFRNGQLRLSDMTGKTVLLQAVNELSENGVISTQNLPEGIYLITIQNQREISSKKLIIRH